jgi:hypothetical protein
MRQICKAVAAATALQGACGATIFKAAKDLRICFWSSYLPRTAEMLRCAQHDRIEVFHTFSAFAALP